MGASDLAHPNDRLRQERLRRNWRQREVAEWIGTTVVTVNRWEHGNQQPSAYFRVKLCALFGKSAEELGIYTEDPQPSIEAETYTSLEHFSLPVDAADRVQDTSLPGADCPEKRSAAISSLETFWPARVLTQKARRKPGWLEAGPQRVYNWLGVLPTVILLSIAVCAVWMICRH